MVEDNARVTLADRFYALALECERERLTLRRVLLALGVRGHGFVALLFTAPFITPIPVPGLSVLFGGVVVFSGLGIALGFPLILPRWLSRRTLPGYTLSKVFKKVSQLMRRVEHLLKPRLLVFSDAPVTRFVVGLFIAFYGFILALPLPPGTNFPPALVCVLLSLGILEKDGVFMALGLVVGVVGVVLSAGVLLYGWGWAVQYFSL